MKKHNRLSELRIRCLFYICRIFPIKKNKIVFCNYVGKGYGCNPKYIAEEIIRRKGKWEMVWLTDQVDNQFPPEIRIVKYESSKAIYELATARVWVDNQRKLTHYRKRKFQYFIETWHGGGGPMKKIGADNPRNFNNKPYMKTSKHMDKIADVMISNSKCCSEIYRSAFLYTGEILEYGYPRNDILVNGWQQIKPKINEFFKIPKGYKTVLYAPTYRNNRDLYHYYIESDKVLKALTTRFLGKWVLLIRLHPTMMKKASDINYGKQVMNASGYDDMQELLAGCDVLISDYSSVISEFAITGKPVFLFATDVKNYAVERDFYVDYYSLPFSISESNDKLVENILGFKEEDYSIKVSQYLTDVGMKEKGTASKSIVDLIEKL